MVQKEWEGASLMQSHLFSTIINKIISLLHLLKSGLHCSIWKCEKNKKNTRWITSKESHLETIWRPEGDWNPRWLSADDSLVRSWDSPSNIFFFPLAVPFVSIFSCQLVDGRFSELEWEITDKHIIYEATMSLLLAVSVQGINPRNYQNCFFG